MAGATMLALATGAYAENWQHIDTTLDGTVIDVDTDSIQRLTNGLRSVRMSSSIELTMFFDCKGRAGPFPTNLQHIPAGTIAEAIAAIVCKA